MNTNVGYYINITGEVQGVGYRYYCKSAADSLGLTGYVMNMQDGSVDVQVFGQKDILDEFISEITKKDAAYQVSGIKKNEIPEKVRVNEFNIMQYPG